MTADSGAGLEPTGSGTEEDVTGGLPAGWVRATLGELGKWYGGGTPSKRNPEFWTDGTIPWLSPKDMGEPVLTGTQDLIHESAISVSPGRLLPAGAVAIVVRSGILERKLPVTYVPFEVTLNQDMKAIVPHESVDGRWLAVLIASQEKRILADCRKRGTTVASLEVSRLMEVEIPVPPLAEQRRIVAKLDDQLVQIEAGEKSLENARERLEDFIAALLSEAIDPSSEVSNWETKTIGELAVVSSGATPLKGRSDYYDGGVVPWVTSSLLNAPFVDRAEKFITDKAVAETAVKEYLPGTLLLAMYGEGKTRGKCSELRIRATTNQACAGIQLRAGYECRRDWVKLLLDARYEENRALASGGVQPNLSLGLIKKIKVPLPPLGRQKEILHEVAQRRADASSMADAIEAVKLQAAELRRALLHTAFTGTLVPQDPDDEPASAILGQIRAERGAGGQPARRKRAHRATPPAAPATSGRPVPPGTQETLPL